MKRAPVLAGLLALGACAAPAPEPVELMLDGRPYPTVERCCGFLSGVLTGRSGWARPGWAYGFKGGHGGRGWSK